VTNNNNHGVFSVLGLGLRIHPRVREHQQFMRVVCELTLCTVFGVWSKWQMEGPEELEESSLLTRANCVLFKEKDGEFYFFSRIHTIIIRSSVRYY
jgi:hypothetical protein